MKTIFFLAFHFLWVVVVQAEIFGISDHSYPHVFITDPVQAPISWHSKEMGFRLQNSAAIRINSRGIRFIPGS